MIENIDKFIHDQMSVWPEIAAAHRALKGVLTRQETVGGLKVTLQHNPSRIASAVVDVTKKKDICLLCAENRPREQRFLPIEGRKGRKYEILLNRYPIFPNHLVIVRDCHVPQTIWHRYVDMLDMAAALQDYVILYNGPFSGASIPEHAHFQACPKGYMPLERAVDRCLGDIQSNLGKNIEYITSVQDAQLYHYLHFARGIFCLKAKTSKSMAKLFYRLLDCAPIAPGESEPRFNAITYCAEGEYRAIVMCRTAHRSHHYFSEGVDHLTMSPGVVDMGGIFIVPQPEDFEKVNSTMLEEMLSEVAISEENEKLLLFRLVRTQPKIEVGILSAESITFEIISDGAGPQTVSYREGKIDYNGVLYDSLVFEAVTISTLFAEPSFILHDVVIGKEFHWQRKVDQRFAGTLKFIPTHGKVTAVDIIGVEDYLVSVISSEMSPNAPLEFLKAHAVISRSWVMSRIENRRRRTAAKFTENFTDTPSLVTWLDTTRVAENEDETDVVTIRKWTDDSLHKHFDVCADDHCQRYQGLGEPSSENPTALTPAQTAVDATWGEVLKYDGEIADARFSKCCGGRTEIFSSAWQDKDYPYLISKEDPWCDTSDEAILSAVLKDYDRETNDFHDWKVTYSVEDLSELISRKSGIDIGLLQALEPLDRGPSGRITRLRIRGSKRTIVVGKELMIRKFLSPSHLYSSAFDVEFMNGIVSLTGHGWGHGVGLCQIGAAVMASKGKTYREILDFYYPGTNDRNI